MSKKLFSSAALLLLALMLSMFAIGCQGEEVETPPEGEGEEAAPLEGAQISVGSKNFTEQFILGYLTLLVLEDAGATVKDNINLGGTEVAREALEKGDIDAYWEYTGTAWLVIFGEDEAITDSAESYRLVKDRDEANGLVWLDYAPFDNTYTLMMRQEHAAELGIETISELGEWVKAQQAAGEKVLFATDHEFSVRDDGYPALEELYGFSFDEVNTMDIGLTHVALRNGEVDVAMGFATDGKIAELELVNLKDDQQFFPVYNPSPVVRADLLQAYPEIKELLGFASLLDTETMIYLNYLVDVEGEEPVDVARDWLVEQGFISE